MFTVTAFHFKRLTAAGVDENEALRCFFPETRPFGGLRGRPCSLYRSPFPSYLERFRISQSEFCPRDNTTRPASPVVLCRAGTRSKGPLTEGYRKCSAILHYSVCLLFIYVIFIYCIYYTFFGIKPFQQFSRTLPFLSSTHLQHDNTLTFSRDFSAMSACF